MKKLLIILAALLSLTFILQACSKEEKKEEQKVVEEHKTINKITIKYGEKEKTFTDKKTLEIIDKSIKSATLNNGDFKNINVDYTVIIENKGDIIETFELNKNNNELLIISEGNENFTFKINENNSKDILSLIK